MKQKLFAFFALGTLALSSCTKTTNNTTVYEPRPAFLVNGIEDITLINNENTTAELYVSVEYEDSMQQTVTLALSSLPAGIVVDTTWQTTGIPTFSTTIEFLDTTQAGATAGTYNMTLTATGSITGKKTFPFTLKVQPQPPCTAFLLGKYFDCSSACSSSGYYTDSVYADPSVANRIWFSNFDNLGAKIYGNYNCSSEEIVVPSQTVGGTTYSGSGEGYYSSSKFIFLELTVTTSSGITTCSVDME